MSVADKIKNPEVPGLECLLPPPPPPPPPPRISGISVNESQPPPPKKARPTPVPPPSRPFPNAMPQSPYYQGMGPPVHPHAATAAASTPWWIPTEVDSSDVYATWYGSPYKTGAPVTPMPSPVAPPPPVEKAKPKPKVFLKRKPEPIDPRADAEKVATAQRELSSLMKPMKCDLCNAAMNSNLQAKRHYDGKPHQKKVSMFLNQSAKKLKDEEGNEVSSTTASDWNSYCEICKTWFTSQMDAAQHYAGKKHVKAAHGIARPSQKKKSSNVPAADPTGLFGGGINFMPRPEPPVPVAAVPVPMPIQMPLPVPVPVPAPVPVPVQEVTSVTSPPVHYPQPGFTILRCDLCGVSANREDQLETHKRGARHLRMLKLNGMPVTISPQEPPSAPVPTGPIDYSIYRTPSGQYYCAPCNLSLNSEIVFAQHIESRKHKNQVNPKVQPPPTTPTKKSHKKK